jgi:hypothetical protein
MSLNIFGFVAKMLPSVSRSDAEVDMEISLEAAASVVDIYTQLSQVQEATKFNSKAAVKLVGEFLKELGDAKPDVKLPTSKKLADVTLTLFKNVLANGAIITKELEDIKSEVIVSQAITASKASILRAVAHYYFMTKYAMDFVNYLTLLEAEHGGVELPRDAQLNKKQVEYINQNLWIYARLLAVYGSDSDKFLSRLSAIQDYQITKDSVDEASVMTSGKIDLFDNLPTGFIGSPIYTIGLVFAQWEADRHKELKDKKKLLELRLLHLRLLQEQGRGDANQEKEITYLQKRCTTLDYKLVKIEESVE